MSDISRARTQSILKVQKTYYAFYIRFGLYWYATYIFALKNILGGKKRENRPKTCFFALRPKNRKTSYSLRRKNDGVYPNGPP